MQKEREGDLVPPTRRGTVGRIVAEGIVVAAGPGEVTQCVARRDGVIRLVERELRYADLTAGPLDVGLGNLPVAFPGRVARNRFACCHVSLHRSNDYSPLNAGGRLSRKAIAASLTS